MSFLLSQTDVLYLSLALNGLLLLRGLVCRLLDLLHYLLRGHCGLLSWVGEIGRIRPGLAGRVLYEHVGLWLLLGLTTMCLKHTSLASQPFREHSACPPLLQATAAVAAAYSLLLATRLAAGRDIHVLQDHAKLRPTQGFTGHLKIDIFYAVADATSKLISFMYKQNLFLCLSTSFFDLASMTTDLRRLMTLLRHHGVGEGALRRVAKANLLLFVLCRILLPLVFLVLAAVEESPTLMDPVPLASFVLSGVVHTGFQAFGLFQSIQLVRRAPEPAPPLPRTCKAGQSASLDVLTNDIPKDTRSTCKESLKGFPLFTGVDYVFMRSYDNRNISWLRDKDSSDKVNILKRKDVSKNALVYKGKRPEEKPLQDKHMGGKKMFDFDHDTSLEGEFTTVDSLLSEPTLSDSESSADSQVSRPERRSVLLDDVLLSIDVGDRDSVT